MLNLQKNKPYLLGVIAGTPFDTALGSNYANSLGIKTIEFPLAKTPVEQTLLQSNSKSIESSLLDAISALQDKGCSSILIYCNSISVSVDILSISRKKNIPIYSPLDAYDYMIDWDCRLLAILTANGNCFSHIEKIILKKNPNKNIIGISLLPMISDIEKEISPIDLIAKYRLIFLLEYLFEIGCQQIMLACTHFEYFSDDLKKYMGHDLSSKIITPFQKILEIQR